MTRTALMAAIFLATAVSCQQKPKDELAAPAVQPAQPAQPAVPVNAAPAPQNLDQVPVSEDFEEQAAQEISANDLDTALQKLDQEIAE